MSNCSFREIFLSTPSARRATEGLCPRFDDQNISIHALREEGDLDAVVVNDAAVKFLSTPSARRATWPRSPRQRGAGHFYPRPPRGGRHLPPDVAAHVDKFLSTPSARRATFFGVVCWSASAYFYPRPPRGGRPPFLILVTHDSIISIHALREEGDNRRRML